MAKKQQHTLHSEAAAAYQALADDDAIIQQALSILEQRIAHGPAMTSPQLVKQYLTLKLAPESREVFGVLLLDQRHRVLRFEVLFQGTLATCSVHPREVVKAAISSNAAALILAHNHPSGDPSPSEVDKALTHRLREALGLIDVRVLDHIVVGGGRAVAATELGWL
ncbi:MAG: RadC family protein [Acidiferrobacteraceae bacterium]